MKKILLLFLLFSFSIETSAQEIMYEVFIRSFYDSNGDRHGDLKGVEQKLDELYKLGVTAIVLSPIYQSDFYHNYYPHNLEKIDTAYGNWDDYKSLVKAVHLRKMKIYQDVQLSYISGNHIWYKDSYNNPDSQYSDYIHYTDKQNKNPVFLNDKEKHTAYKGIQEQVVTVNLSNPKVQKYFLETLSHLVYVHEDAMGKEGVDGFRFIGMGDGDTSKGMSGNQLTVFWKPLAEGLKKVNPELEIIALQADKDSYGFDCLTKGSADRVYANPLREAIVASDKKKIITAADSTFAAITEGKQQIVFLENSQTDRFASSEGVESGKLKAMAALNFFMGGVPSLYYGQEIGTYGKQTEIAESGENIPVRQSYKWYADTTSTGTALWYMDNAPWKDKHLMSTNDGFSMEEQQKTPNSLLDFYKELIKLRRRQPAIALGNYKNISNTSDNVISFTREGGGQKIFVMINLSGSQQVVSITDTTLPLQKLQSIMGSANYKFPKGGYTLVLPPYWVQVWKIV
ncbi:hypothetical protein E0W68_03865 [Flavobacterium salilacus subsp. salilacus]|uniref:alpha-amylase family glycosyl hydrolase n=1 Tax=Flavobacterium TaxID=237 RepID=UPI00107589C4|nr:MULTISPECIES: alpha-amylase family glycosyl hydrolase [Flavobacterium]KAF2519494.1 hypothetical protein E0W68_03865 [Flavobacterium salilacus subsp. salilacus]MBE1614609.1 hypothetical protein [Flavobacterium sp. SaA2.13]